MKSKVFIPLLPQHRAYGRRSDTTCCCIPYGLWPHGSSSLCVCLLLLDNAKACSHAACQGDFERLIWSSVKEKISYTLCYRNSVWCRCWDLPFRGAQLSLLSTGGDDCLDHRNCTHPKFQKRVILNSPFPQVPQCAPHGPLKNRLAVRALAF